MHESTDHAADWARSGAMALTGRRSGPPLLPPGRAASSVRPGLTTLGLPIPGILGERAAYAGLTRNGPASCGNSMRILAALDGHVALSLARPSDHDLIPALVESEVTGDPWAAVAAWVDGVPVAEASSRFELLGLPGGAVGSSPRLEGAVSTAALGSRTITDRPVIVDLTSLWAGPLCAHLLGRGGAHVIKVESTRRPDGARRGPADFFDLLHRDHEQLTVDFATPAGTGQLRELIARADLVLESSRPRALRQLDVIAEDVVAAGTSWLSITACGRSSNAVGFGDDVAARAGAVLVDGDEVLPVGDALADPVAGVRAAVEAQAALNSSEARLIDLSMLDVLTETMGQVQEHEVHRADGTWWVETAVGRSAIRDPERRR